ncbi:MAG: hypothetical protein KAR40_01440 [Candidatus Sabulitectum sp.]|nr:hypothetical protein [Candidatus Sabulitectum sp.]
MDPVKIMDGLSSQILAALKAMSKAKTAEEKLTYSKTVKNLCDSLSGFFELMNGIIPFDEYDEGEEEEYDEDDDENVIPF